MIDSVLKGTGNSRFLKSAVPAGTSWADALAMLQAGTFPIDFNGINTEGFQQVGTPLNKANLLKDATAAQIGLPPSTTPDGMFQALGNTGELHVWRKTVVTKDPVPEVPGSYTLGTAKRLYVATRTFANDSYESYVEGVLASNAITIDLDGKVTLTDPAKVNLYIYNRRDGVTSQTGREAISGYSYFLIPSTSASFIGCNISMPKDAIYYIPATSNYYRTSSSSGGQSSFDAAQLVTGVPGTPAIPAGTTTTYPVSTNQNAYQEGDDAKEAGYTLGEVIKSTGAYGFFGMMGFAYGTSYFQKISDAIEVADDGSVSHVAPVDDISDSTVLDSASVLKERIAGKYITLSENSYTKQPYTNELPPTNAVLYIPADVNVKMIHPEDSSLSNQYALFFDRYQPVTGYAAIPAGTTIEYLGKLGDKARVQFGSYVGTGTYGSSNPNTLTFDFVPKMVIISGYTSNGYTTVTFVRGASSAGYPANGTMYFSMNLSWNDKKVSWYNDAYDAAQQANKSGYRYNYVAIG